MDQHGLKQLGRYRILRLLGRGAMGRVYLAQDPNIDRLVAIKTFCAEEFVSPSEAKEAHKRFQREARSAGSLVHPNIVIIYDVGEDGPYSFIAMEYIDGTNLAHFTRPDRLLAPHKVLKLGIQAAGALHYAHEKGILHRDIKPANLMVSREGVLKITDFGLAKQFGATVTRTKALIGTPSYIAPEQIRGDEVDGRADLFALGVVLYELLTGTRPFGGESVSAVIYNILNEQPEPASQRRPDLPPGLDQVLGRLLAKVPDERYADGAEVARDLENLLLGRAPGGGSTEGRLTETLVSNPVTAKLQPADLVHPGTDPHGPISLPMSGSAAARSAVAEEGRRSRKWLIALLVLLPFLAAAGGAAWYASRNGLLGRLAAGPPPEPAASIVVRTGPDATVFLDGRPVTPGPGGRLELPPGPGPWVLQARGPCAESEAVEVWRGQPRVELPLTRTRSRPLETDLPLPPGWKIVTVDDAPFEGNGPLRLDACREHRLELGREGFRRVTVLLPPLGGEGKPDAWQAIVRATPLPTGPLRARVRFRLPPDLARSSVRVEGADCRSSDPPGTWDCAPGEEARVTVSNCSRLLWTRFRTRMPEYPGADVEELEAKLPARVTLTVFKPGPLYTCEAKLSGCADGTARSSGQKSVDLRWRVSGYAGTWKLRCWRFDPGEESWRTVRVGRSMEYRWVQ